MLMTRSAMRSLCVHVGVDGGPDVRTPHTTYMVRRLLFSAAGTLFPLDEPMHTPNSTPALSSAPDPELAVLATRLRDAVAAVGGGTGTRTQVERAARDFTGALKGDHFPPEQMLLRIKELLAEAGLRPTYAAATSSENLGDVEANLYRDVITWCIRDYYDHGATS
jgi:hypothetical protein